MTPGPVPARPLPLPKAPLERLLRRETTRRLPELRARPIPPLRHPEVTLLIYWFPKADAEIEGCEFALRQSLTVLGRLPTVIVTDRARPALVALATALGATIQEEPSLCPGDIWSMTLDCVSRLYRRFTTRHVLIVQNDGFPFRDDLAPFLRYDYVGAPDVAEGLREQIADAVGLTVLNGGFSLRSRRICRAVAWRWNHLWRHFLPVGHPWLSEDFFYTRTLRLFDPIYRLMHRFAPSPIARTFSVECLDGLRPIPPTANPMGFHGRLTINAFWEETPRLTVVSVVRDEACYRRCLRDNPHLAGADFVAYDNTTENRPIPERYNAFLDTMPAETEWILFAHEDFEPREDPRPLLRQRNPLFPYGLIGTRRVLNSVILPFGAITHSDRDGAHAERLAPLPLLGQLLDTMVDAFDCCGFFIHAECLRTWGLRFDPQCAWDLYAEDLCYQFQCRTGHLARLIALEAHHWSRGDTSTQRFLTTADYLNNKYRDTCFAGGICIAFIGGRPSLRFRFWRRLVRGALWIRELLRG